MIPFSRLVARTFSVALLSGLFLVQGSGFARAGESGADPDAFAKEAGVAVAAAGPGIGVRGVAEGWWFLRSELESLAQGRFWEGDLSATTATGVDPVPVIAKYNGELEALGVRLVLCPVPAKAALYPEKLSAEVALDAGLPAPGSVHSLAPFLQQLDDLGVEVVDLEPMLRDLRESSGEQLYCAQDSHWSPATCRFVACILAELIRDESWAVAAREAFGEEIVRTDSEVLRIHGDLLTDAEKESEPEEELAISHVGTGSAKAPEPLDIDPSSPVLVVGDSHTLVFNEGADFGMHDRGAGLVDHLAAELGFPVDREASKGSGGDSARANVARRSKSEADLWEKKKVLFWVFSAREFSLGKWRPIPANVD